MSQEKQNLEPESPAPIETDPRKERIYYSALLILVLALIWVMKDVVLLNEEVFTKAEEYVFLGSSEVEVKARIKLEIKRYQLSPEPAEQVLALAHLLECYYYQLFTRRSGMDRYFDFIKIALLPSQRVQLKNKTEYTRQVGRYLKRKKNLHIEILKYELSEPRFEVDGKLFDVHLLVKRTSKSVSGPGTEIFQYHFRRHSDNRYYLFFSDSIPGNTRYRMIETQKEKREE